MKCICKRCKYKWESIVPKPKQCPRCKSYMWNVKRKREKKTYGLKQKT